MSDVKRLVVLSGIRPTGPLHLGNHLGAVQDWISLSEKGEFECWYFLANLHMLTTRVRSKKEKTGIDPKELLDDQIGLVLDLLAAGLKPENAVIYAQTSIPELTELMWLLNTLTPVSHLTQMHHFKEKKGRLEDEGITANAGLLTYPVLMAADILGVKADIIPVGEDQKAHVEFARDLARRFNREYGELFPIPDVWLKEDAVRVPSIDCTGKMGKSHPAGSIFYRDSKKQIRKKFGSAVKAVSDPPRTSADWQNDPGDPTKCNVFSFYDLIGSEEDKQWAADGCRNATIGCGHCKVRMAGLVDDLFAPIRERRNALDSDEGRKQAMEILHEGGKKARARVQEVVERAKDLVGVPTF